MVHGPGLGRVICSALTEPVVLPGGAHFHFQPPRVKRTAGTGTKPPRDLYCKDAFWTVDIRQTWARDHPAPTPTWLVVHRILRARAGPGIPRIVRLRAAFRAAGMQRFQHSCLLGYSLSLHGVFSRPSLASPKIQRHSGRPCCLLSASVRYMKLKLSGSSS